MNDVLPKPFTKEGLLLVLDKHLAHLKRGGLAHGSDGMGAPPVQPLAHTSASQSIKDEHSPSKSPATASNWNSPSQVAGVSPSTTNMTDDYMGAVQAQAGYGMQPGMPTTPGIPPGYTTAQPLGVQQNRGQPHRRQISDISGGADDHQQQMKRQQMYGQPPMQPQQMNPMHRPR